MKSRWKWLVGILVVISLAALVLLTTLNREWQPDFLQTLKAFKSEENTHVDDKGKWSKTRVYHIPSNYSDVVASMEKEMNQSQWQWSKSTIQDHHNGKRRTYYGWYIERDNHSLQIEDKPEDRLNHTVRLVWHETPGKFETYWNSFKSWLGASANKKP